MTNKKKRAECKHCPAQYDPCLWSGAGDEPAHIIVVGPAPSGFTIGRGRPFFGRHGRLFQTVLNVVRAYNENYRDVKVYYTYAARVGAYEPKARHVECCRPILLREIDGVRSAGAVGPVIVPLGPVAAKAVGLKFRKIASVVGREFTLPFPSVSIEGNKRMLPVVPLLSMKHLEAKIGTSNVVISALNKAVSIAYGERPQDISLEEITKDYVYPKTLQEVKSLVDEIIDYYDPERGTGPQNWVISIDTETNTLHPYSHPDPKTLMLSVGWDVGKAATILLDHPEVPYDPKEAWKYVAKLLRCQKPKVFHNWKFDMKFLELVNGIKVNRVTWDSMLGEHYVDEDKKGFYSLKQLTPLYASSYEGYDDELQDLLRGSEDDTTDEEAAEAEVAVVPLTMTDAEIIEHNDLKGCPDGRPHDVWTNLVRNLIHYRDMRSIPKKKRTAEEQELFTETSASVKLYRKELDIKKPRKSKKDEKKDGGYEEIALETILQYAAIDADVTRIILRAQTTRLRRTDSWEEARNVMQYLYLPGSRALSRMEFRGFKIDADYHAKLTVEVEARMNAAEELLHSRFDPTLKLNAPHAVADYMAQLNFASIPGEEAGGTGKELLAKYQKMYPPEDARHVFVKTLLEYRESHKTLKTYLKAYSRLIRNGKIHCRFHLNGTSTGRLSSASPNLQNVPYITARRVEKDENGEDVVVHPGYNIKKLFIPSKPGYVIVNCDIKGAELRVYTVYSHDQLMIDALNKGMDVHSLVTSKVYKMDYDEVNDQKETDPEIKEKRTRCKRTVFGTFYGAGPYKIAQQIESTKEEAEQIQNYLFSEFPDLRAYVQGVEHEVRQHRMVSTIFGRRRRFQMAHVSNKTMGDAIREAVNFKIQSTAADLVLSQLCEMDEHFHEIGAEMLITVHDSMVFQMPAENVPLLTAFLDQWIVKRVAEKYPWLPVPFLYDVDVGPSYGEVKPLEKYNAQQAQAG